MSRRTAPGTALANPAEARPGVERVVREERTSARHPGDVVRLVVGLLVLAVAVLAVNRDSLTLFERDVFRVINDLPAPLAPYADLIMQAGNLAFVFVVAGIALLARRRRLAIDALLIGPPAWFTAKIIKSVIARPRPAGFLTGILHHGTAGGMGFVSGHTTIAAAMAAAATPYLSRRWSRLAWVGVWAVGLGRIYVGAHLPLDVVGGAALGWAFGAGVHLLIGAPHRRPRVVQVRRVLERAGVTVTVVRRAGGALQGSYPFVAEGPAGRTFVKMLDPEPRDRDWIFRLARFLAFRDVRDEAMLDNSEVQAEHEAAMALLAHHAGCRVPAVRAVEADGGATWIVEDYAGSRSLASMDPAEVSDQLLSDLWDEVATMHAAGVVHRDLIADNIVVDEQGRPWLVDFAHARSIHHGREAETDVAELLVSTAALVGPERATSVAAAVLGLDRVAASLAELQPLALTAVTRRQLRHQPELLDALRDKVIRVTGAVTVTTEPVKRDRMAVAVSSLGAAVLLGLVVAAGPRAVADGVHNTSWRWLGLAALAVGFMFVNRAAVVVAACDRRLSLGRTALVAAAAVAGRARFGTSGPTVYRRYLERSGVEHHDAVAALDRFRRSRVAAAAVVVGVLTAIATRSAHGTTLFAAAAAGGGLALMAFRMWQRRGDLAQSAHDLPLSDWVVQIVAATVELFSLVLAVVAADKALGGSAAIATIGLTAIVVAALADIVDYGAGISEVALAGTLVVAGSTFAVAVGTTVIVLVLVFWAPVLIAPLLVKRLSGRLVL